VSTDRPRGLAPRAVFLTRLGRSLLLSTALVAGTLALGTIGYHALFPGAGWVDAFHQASLLMSGMGPVLPEDPGQLSDAAKLFDSLYALFCGVVLLGAAGILFAPVVHRVLHRFHLEDTR
jgi:hypothetical protein